MCVRMCVCLCVCGFPNGQTANILRTGRPFTSRGHWWKKFVGVVVGTHTHTYSVTHTCTRFTFPLYFYCKRPVCSAAVSQDMSDVQSRKVNKTQTCFKYQVEKGRIRKLHYIRAQNCPICCCYAYVSDEKCLSRLWGHSLYVLLNLVQWCLCLASEVCWGYRKGGWGEGMRTDHFTLLTSCKHTHESGANSQGTRFSHSYSQVWKYLDDFFNHFSFIKWL